MTPIALVTEVPLIGVKTSKKATSQEPLVSKYTQNPFGVHLKEYQNSKKTAPICLRHNKEGQMARRMQTVGNSPRFEIANGKVKTCKGKNLSQVLEKKKSQQKEAIPGCTTWSLKPQKLKKKACQDTPLISLEEITFYPLT